MKNRRIKSSWILLLLWIPLFLSLVISCKNAPSPSQQAEISEKVHLTVLYPSEGSMKVLKVLREQGFLDIEDLCVVGVYHTQEKTDYSKAMDYVKKEKMDWVTFLELTGDLHKNNLFQNNPLSSEFEKIFESSDGIILFGGADIPPYIYDHQTNLHTQITSPIRSFLETSFVFHLLGGFQDSSFSPLLESRPEFPVLGICLGLQSLNVGTGGSLIQDIWSEIYTSTYFEEVIKLGSDAWHTNPYARLYPERGYFPINLHPIKLREDGMLVSRMGMKEKDTPYVLSSHHQMTKNIGKGFRVIATSMDEKVVEAIEHEIYPNVLGLQFHPETPRIWASPKKTRFTPDDAEETTLLEFLDGKPPSVKFHKRIWAWFTQALKTR